MVGEVGLGKCGAVIGRWCSMRLIQEKNSREESREEIERVE